MNAQAREVIEFVRTHEKQPFGPEIRASAGNFVAFFQKRRREQTEHVELIRDQRSIGKKLTDEVFERVTQIDHGVLDVFTAWNFFELIFEFGRGFSVDELTDALVIVIDDHGSEFGLA